MTAISEDVSPQRRDDADRSPPRRMAAKKLGPGASVGLMFIVPNLVGVLLFTLIPLIGVVVLAFSKWDLVSGLSGIEFTGLQNFSALMRDSEFWSSALRTIVYAGVTVPASVLIGLALGLALNRDVPGRSALRAIFFLPYIVNVVAIGMTWLMILNPYGGLVNQVLDAVGLRDLPGWFASSRWALPALMLIGVWSCVGYAAVIYLAALQDTPADLYEAADIDGAGPWRRFRVVTWPALMPTTFFLLVTIFISISQGFGLIALITSGGPGDSTTTLSYYMYQTAFRLYHFGYASAIGLATFGGVLALTLLGWYRQRGRGLYE